MPDDQDEDIPNAQSDLLQWDYHRDVTILRISNRDFLETNSQLFSSV